MVRGIAMLFSLIFLVEIAAYSQERRNPSLEKSSRNKSLRAPSVSKEKARIICPIFENSEYPYQGFGLKVGDPVALTYKWYPTKSWSFAVDAGKAASGLYSKYYRKIFSEYLPDSLKYLSHVVNADWFFEGKVLHQWSIEKISPGLHLYAGVGWQWRMTKLEYTHFYQEGQFEQASTGTFDVQRFTYGPTAVLGFEYAYFSLPLSAFIEIEGFMDALVDPGYKRFQGGMGLRYVF